MRKIVGGQLMSQSDGSGVIRRVVRGVHRRLSRTASYTKKGVRAFVYDRTSTVASLSRDIRLLERRIESLSSQLAYENFGAVDGRTTPGTRTYGTLKPHDITRQPPLGYHSAIEARTIYKPAFWRGINFLFGNAIKGPIVEFGCRTGFTSRCLAEAIVERNLDAKLYLYDSFSGLPEISSFIDQSAPEVREQNVWFDGSMAMPAGTPKAISDSLEEFLAPSRFEIVQGYFSDVLPSRLPKEKISLVHIDCDLYSSTMEVLNALVVADLLQDGCLLYFDDYNCSRANPKYGERRALIEFLGANTHWSASPFISYGWHGQGYILHENI